VWFKGKEVISRDDHFPFLICAIRVIGGKNEFDTFPVLSASSIRMRYPFQPILQKVTKITKLRVGSWQHQTVQAIDQRQLMKIHQQPNRNIQQLHICFFE
jgi:hypothetical protein